MLVVPETQRLVWTLLDYWDGLFSSDISWQNNLLTYKFIFITCAKLLLGSVEYDVSIGIMFVMCKINAFLNKDIYMIKKNKCFFYKYIGQA